MSRRGTEKRRLPGQILARLTAEQQKVVTHLAEADGVSKATWLRRLIADSTGVDAGLVVSRTHPPELILELAHTREIVAELVGALAQAAIAARQDGRPVEHATIEALIPEIKAAVFDLDRLKEKLWRPVA